MKGMKEPFLPAPFTPLLPSPDRSAILPQTAKQGGIIVVT